MAKILTTKGSAAALEDLIRRAEKEIINKTAPITILI